MPIIGAGSGGFDVEAAQRIMVEALEGADESVAVVIVRFGPPRKDSKDGPRRDDKPVS